MVTLVGQRVILTECRHAGVVGAYDRQPRTTTRVAVLDPVLNLVGLWDRIAANALHLWCAMAGTIVKGRAVDKPIRVTLEIGPKGKKVASDSAGLCPSEISPHRTDSQCCR